MTYWLEGVDLAFAIGDEPDRNTLYAARAQVLIAGADLSPQQRAQFEPHDPVEHAASLLRHYQIHIHGARVFYSIFDRRLCDLVKHDPLGRCRVQAEHLAKMPAYCLSLTVFVRREPHFVGAFSQRPQTANDLL